jgi:hypothetical protein
MNVLPVIGSGILQHVLNFRDRLCGQQLNAIANPAKSNTTAKIERLILYKNVEAIIFCSPSSFASASSLFLQSLGLYGAVFLSSFYDPMPELDFHYNLLSASVKRLSAPLLRGYLRFQ